MHTRLTLDSLCSCNWPWIPHLPASASKCLDLPFPLYHPAMFPIPRVELAGFIVLWRMLHVNQNDLWFLTFFYRKKLLGNSDNHHKSLNESLRDKCRFIMRKGWEFEKKIFKQKSQRLNVYFIMVWWGRPRFLHCFSSIIMGLLCARQWILFFMPLLSCSFLFSITYLCFYSIQRVKLRFWLFNFFLF